MALVVASGTITKDDTNCVTKGRTYNSSIESPPPPPAAVVTFLFIKIDGNGVTVSTCGMDSIIVLVVVVVVVVVLS